MCFKTKKQTWKNILRNAGILGGISGASQMLVTQNFSYAGIMTGFFTAVMVGLIELKHAYKVSPSIRYIPQNKTYFLS